MIGAIALDKPGASRPDVGRYGQAELESLRNLVAALFRLEGSRGVEDVRRAREALIDWLAGAGAGGAAAGVCGLVQAGIFAGARAGGGAARVSRPAACDEPSA